MLLHFFEASPNIPPAEAEARYYEQLNELATVARLKQTGLRKTRGGSLPIWPPD